MQMVLTVLRSLVVLCLREIHALVLLYFQQMSRQLGRARSLAQPH
jgi:hypothetical protein